MTITILQDIRKENKSMTISKDNFKPVTNFKYCPECGQPTLYQIEVCERTSDYTNISYSCKCSNTIVYIYKFTY